VSLGLFPYVGFGVSAGNGVSTPTGPRGKKKVRGHFGSGLGWGKELGAGREEGAGRRGREAEALAGDPKETGGARRLVGTTGANTPSKIGKSKRGGVVCPPQKLVSRVGAGTRGTKSRARKKG